MLRAAVMVVLVSLFGYFLIASAPGQGLNSLFGVRIWQDENLWDDRARNTADRLDLSGVRHASGEFYRGEFGGSVEVLGSPLYALDLYTNNGVVQRLVLGFLNRADLHASIEREAEMAPIDEREARNRLVHEFDRNLRAEQQTIRTRLIQRLGQPAQGRDGAEVWTWVGHELVLQRGHEALTLAIQKGGHSPTASAHNSIYESGAKLLPLTSHVRRTSEGDVFIDNIPPINQGNRGYCVPASWEKCLRYYGLSLDVYTLAQEGDTRVYGSLFMPFARGVSRIISPHGYQVEYPRASPDDFAFLKRHIDQGIPIIWGMDSQLLTIWATRSQMRRTRLPSTPPIIESMPGTPALHALLIVGYNERFREIALSDSTEFGHSMPYIWVPAAEIKLANADRIENFAIVIPPASRGAPARAFVRPRWY